MQCCMFDTKSLKTKIKPLTNTSTKLNFAIRPLAILIFYPFPFFVKTFDIKIFWLMPILRSPSERQTAWTVCSFFDQRFMKLASSPRVNDGPTLFTVILQARDVRAEKWRKFSATAHAMAFVTHLVVKDVRFHFDLLVKND